MQDNAPIAISITFAAPMKMVTDAHSLARLAGKPS